jgi:hypothetical protein
MKSRLLPFLTAFILAIGLAACSRIPAEPTRADVQAGLDQQIRLCSQGGIKLVKFDASPATILGPLAVVNVRAEIEFLEDGRWPNPMTLVFLKPTSPGDITVRMGEHRNAELRLQFLRTARGWTLPDVPTGSAPAPTP